MLQSVFSFYIHNYIQFGVLPLLSYSGWIIQLIINVYIK